jgi:polyphenol oxidase
MSFRSVQATDRRRFLALGAAAGAATWLDPLRAFAQATPPPTCTPSECDVPFVGPPQPWTPLGRPLAPRRSAWDLTPREIARLRAAYAKMWALPPSDGRSMQGQRNLHAYYCVTCGSGPGFPGGDIHFSWNFLPWHRMFLYFHERILGGLIGDMSLRLPYWDWEIPARAILPPAYADPANANPLYDPRRYLKAGQTVERMLTNFNTGKQRFYQLALIHRLLDCTWDQFGGTRPTGDPNLPPAGGVVESGSHGFVHVSSGGDATRYDELPCSGDMAILNTAARDPIFYTHHGNLDRLWWSWETTARNHNPTDPAWLGLQWSFFDETGAWISMKVSDMLDMTRALDVTYERKVAPAPMLVAARGMQVAPVRRIDLLAPSPRLLAAPNAASLAHSAAGELVVSGLPALGDGDFALLVHTAQATFELGDVFLVPHGGGHRTMAMNADFNVCIPLWGDYVSPPNANPALVTALLDPHKTFSLQSSSVGGPRLLGAELGAQLGTPVHPRAAELVVR